MANNFIDCENCDGKGFRTVGFQRWNHEKQQLEAKEFKDEDCDYCFTKGIVPDHLANEREAAQNLAHSLAKLIQWVSPENENDLAAAIIQYRRASHALSSEE